MEYIIENVSNKEIKILESNKLDWYLDDVKSRDIVFDNEKNRDQALDLFKINKTR